MDKSTLSNYGWVVIVTLVLSVMLAFATPFGSYVAKATANVVKYYKEVTGDTFSASYLEKEQDKWEDYFDEKTLIPIGLNVPEYVIAEFNGDFSKVRIYKNGEDSDGLMKNWILESSNPKEQERYSPFRKYAKTLKTVIVEEGVKSIGDSAFYTCDEITDVVFNDDLEKIGNSAFYSCDNLKEVIVPESVTSLGSMVFRDCINLKTAKLSNNITTLKPYTFLHCTALEELLLPNKLETIGIQSIQGCASLKHIQLPETLKKIESQGFASCGSLLDIDMPENCIYIGTKAFEGCKSLESIKVSSKLEYIGGQAFMNALITSFEIPATVHTIEYNPFVTCVRLQDLTVQSGNTKFKTINNVLYDTDITRLITVPSTYGSTYNAPSTLKIVDDYAFADTYKLNSITLNEGLTTIDTNAFYYAGLFATLYIPTSVSFIDDTAFSCVEIRHINVDDNNPYFLDEDTVKLFSKDKSKLYKVTISHSEEHMVIPNSVTSITANTFTNLPNLKSITIPETITDLKVLSFWGCSKDLIIKGKSGSAIHQWAKDNNYKFITI